MVGEVVTGQGVMCIRSDVRRLATPVCKQPERQGCT